MLYKKQGSQDLKLKNKVSASLKLLHNSKYQFITKSYQSDACDRGFSDTIVLLSIPMLVVARWRLSTSVPPAIRFLFLHFTCFIVENVFSNVYISKHIFIAKSFSLGNLSLLTNFQRLSTVYFNAVIKRCYTGWTTFCGL